MKTNTSLTLTFFTVGLFFFFRSLAFTNVSQDEKLSLMMAVQETLKNQPDILLQKEAYEEADGNYLKEKGAFDFFLTGDWEYTRTDVPYSSVETEYYGYDNQKADTYTATLGVNKTFKNGLKSELSYTYDKTDDKRPVSGYPVISTETVTFSIVKPLFRDGKDSVSYNLDSAEMYRTSADYSLKQTVNDAVKESVTAFWDYLSAWKILDLRQEIETRAQGMLEDTKRLIAADEKPAAEIRQVAASLAEKISSRIQAEKDLYQAKQQLGIAMGMAFDKIDTISPPLDMFSLLEKTGDINHAWQQELIQHALKFRWDMLSSEITEKLISRELDAARDQKKRKLDLGFSLSVNGVADNKKFYETTYENHTEGPSGSITLSGEWPVKNNAAKGNLYAITSKLNQSRIERKELGRQISSLISIAVKDYRLSVDALVQTNEAVASYKEALLNEEKKMKLGFSTISDVINMADRLNAALISQITQQSKVAAAIIELRYQTATIFKEKSDVITVNKDAMITIPKH